MAVHSKGLRRLAVVAVVVAATLVVGFGPGDDFETLVFEDNRPLTLTWDQAKDGVDVKVCNIGDTRLQSLRAVLTGFNFQVNENLVADEAVLKQPPTITPWDAEKCTLVTIQTIKRPVPPAPGTYTGLVVISSPGAGMIRREVIIQVESATPEPTPVEGAAGKLAFEDKSDLTLTWERAKTEVNVNVCNDGNAQLQSLQAVLRGFNFLENKILVADEEVLKAPAIASALDAEKCTSVTIRATGESIPDPGKYEGVLVVSAVKGDGTTERISLNVTVEVAPVESALEKIVLTATRYGFLSRAVRLDNRYLPLQSTGNEEMPTPASKDTLIGLIDNEGRLGRVYVDGPVKSEVGVDLLPVRIDDLDVGTYSGKLDVAGTGDAKQAIPIEVKVTDHIGWAIGAIALGLVIAVLSLLQTQRWRYRSQLEQRGHQLEQSYQEAESVFRHKYGKSEFSAYKPNYKGIERYHEDFEKALKTYCRNTWFFETEGKDFKELVKTLEAAEKDAKVFGELGLDGKLETGESPFGNSLEKLREDLKEFEDFVREQFPEHDNPDLVSYARHLLQGCDLDVGEAQKTKDKADEYVKMIKDWRDMAKKHQRYQLWGVRLSKKIPANELRDRAVLRRARAKVVEAKYEMWDAKDAVTLNDLGASKDLKRAYTQLAYLGSTYNEWRPERPEVEDQLPDWTLYSDVSKRVAGKKLEWEPDQQWGLLGDTFARAEPEDSVVQELFAVSISPEMAASIAKTVRRLGDVFVLFTGAAVAILLGLNQLYFDKTFGTWQDYLSAILIGVSTPTLLTVLTDSIKQIGKRLKS